MKNCRRIAILSMLFLFCFVTLRTYAEQDEVEKRLSKAKDLGLSDWVDEEGYLKDEFFEGKTDSELSKMGIDNLIRTVTNEELEIYVTHLNAGISPLTVTYYQKVSQVNPDTGRTLYTGLFRVDGRLAYCIERSVTTPAQGSPTGSWQAVTNDNLRKVLYYGYNGPKDSGYTYVETALAAGEANGDGDNSLGRKVLASIKTKASPPSTFKVWKVTTNGGSTQDLAFYTVVENGKGRVQKTSADSSATSGNSNYSLQGAVYGIYTNAACTALAGKVTTGADGYSNTLSLAPGTYYAKEITAPKGYALSTEVKTMSIKSSATTTVVITNRPKLVIPTEVIQKVDAETNEPTAQGKGTLQGAEFLVKYYADSYEAGVDPATLGVTPAKKWTFRTDETGKVKFQKEYLASGDSFFVNASGIAGIPYGVITIQEVTASEGYRVNPQIYVKAISNGSSTLEATSVPEQAIQVELTKYRENTTTVLEGAVFEHVSPDGTIEQAASDADGKIVWKGLRVGEHQIRESKAPTGYRDNLNVVIFTVDKAGAITVTSDVNKGYGDVRTNLDEKGNLRIEVENKIGYRFPETGHTGAAAMVVLGISCCMYALHEEKSRIKPKKFRRILNEK